MSIFHRKRHVRDVASRQREAEKALRVSKQTAEILDELETEVMDKMRLLRRLNQENNFSARLAAVYGGES